MQFRIPDHEYAAPFAAYRNYVEDVAGSLGGRYGLAETLVDGVYEAVGSRQAVRRIQRRRLSPADEGELQRSLRGAWARLRSMQRELADEDFFDENANALLPMQGYYVIYHGARAYAVASGQAAPNDHASALKLLSKEVGRNVFPYPWSASCTGCPSLGTHTFAGLTPTGDSPHVWSTPDPETSEDRLAMFLRTTRQKELDRRFAEARARLPVKPGKTRANLPRAEKERLAAATTPTTLFDGLWRMRKKANYEDSDAFVLGSGTEFEARRFAEGLVIVTNASLAALEGVMGAYLGPDLMADAAESYLRKTGGSTADVQVQHRAEAWRRRAAGLPSLPPRLRPQPVRWPGP